jgi:hypothetical protein
LSQWQTIRERRRPADTIAPLGSPGTVVDVTDAPQVPQLPARLTDPRPVLTTGTVLFAIATLIVWASGDRFDEALPTCIAGLAVGALGTTIFWIQRRAARRGSKGAQSGLT